ncbi:hypothetical protein [Acidomonas methanolica]|uniref:Uncharacterized protein n=2 Tax=Acidomonas methanolica TaxID=437 RepID=A0A023D6Q1_ACIMT|nr:hypothetical protein [Acidomonas methanolica]GAJ29754.1 hypothetical protein Amme_076_047 [Acidomonas methanolica NBRC 104435]GEL00009.1 hypothetical protein AME01nite_25070 [Acidomonas methanolica NBRC 104435]
MRGDELRAAIAVLWNGNQTRAARELGLSSARRIREFLSGARDVPGGVAVDVRAFLAMFPDGTKSVDPRTALSILAAQLVRTGWTEEMAAAAILGAAQAHAAKILGREGLAELLREDAA